MGRNSRVFSDIDMNFTANDIDGDLFKRYDENAIKTSLKNLILTSNGERPFHPEIGSPIRNLLFSNYTPMLLLSIRRAIEDMVNNFEPRVEVLDVMVDFYEDENEADIGIVFLIKNTNTKMSMNVTLDRTR